VPALTVGGPPSMGKATVKIPTGAAAGTYYLLGCDDDTGGVPETDEKNNCIASGTTVVVSLPEGGGEQFCGNRHGGKSGGCGSWSFDDALLSLRGHGQGRRGYSPDGEPFGAGAAS